MKYNRPRHCEVRSNLFIVVSIFLVALVSVGCELDKKEVILEVKSLENNIKYAKGFTIKQFEDYKVITINKAWKGAAESHQYVLYAAEKPKELPDATFIKIPIKSIACMSLTHIAFLEKLGLENSITALSGCDYVSSVKIKQQIENNTIQEIGQDQHVNYEMLVEKSPDFVMAYGINSSSNKSLNKMKELGLNVVLNSEYMETHPLGMAEWIKFVAAFYDEDEKAAEIFNQIEKEYLSLLALTAKIKERPTVFIGMPWSGSWYVPGGKSFQAQLLKDAGATYLWLDNDETGSLIKAKEIVIDEAYEAEFWLNQNSYNSITSVTNFDEKFKGFAAVKKQQLFNNDNRLNNNKGNDYWESGVINPDVILKDLIEVFHPKLIEHELYYYRKLE